MEISCSAVPAYRTDCALMLAQALVEKDLVLSSVHPAAFSRRFIQSLKRSSACHRCSIGNTNRIIFTRNGVQSKLCFKDRIKRRENAAGCTEERTKSFFDERLR